MEKTNSTTCIEGCKYLRLKNYYTRYEHGYYEARAVRLYGPDDSCALYDIDLYGRDKTKGPDRYHKCKRVATVTRKLETLSDYRRLTKKLFGAKSESYKFIVNKIKEANKVEASESQMMALFNRLENNKSWQNKKNSA